ncbi:MAG: hypothetical protein ACI9CE_000539 [Flavobacterium sp.]|jgi:hypothetical protein
MNRRIRNRMYGGVGGRERQLCLLPDGSFFWGLVELVIELSNTLQCSLHNPYYD